ncbi:MAG: tetratricopeptide repeat protein [Nitrospinaceae bacterium]
MAHFILSLTLLFSVFAQDGFAVEKPDPLSRGIEWFQERSYEKALDEFKSAVENRPSNADAHYFLGLTYSKLERFEEAIPHFEKTIEIDPQIQGVYLNLGIALFNIGSYDLAQEKLNRAVETDPLNPSTQLFLGLIRQKKKLDQESLPFFKRAMQLDPSLESLARFNIGLAHFNMDRADEAKNEFNRVVEIGMDPDLVQSSREFLEIIKKRKADDKTWWVKASTHIQFDDNVTVVEQDEVTGKEDTAYIFEFGSGYNLSSKPAFGMSVGYDFYQSFFKEQSDLDFQSHSFSLGTSHEAETWDTRLDYSFVHTTLGQEGFLNMHNIIPRFGFSLSSNLYTSISYMFQDKNFVSLNVRDATNHSGTVNQFIFFMDNKAYALLGYKYDDEDALDNEFDYRGHLLTAGFNLQLPWDSKLFSSYQYNLRLYKNLTAEIERDRRDEKQTVKMIFTKKISDYLDFKIDYEHIQSTSNLESVDFKENIVMFGLALTM